jgi:signal transduction histidine kinase
MCGREISQGILCDKCDRPKRTASSKGAAAPALRTEEVPHEHEHEHVASEPAADPFPKAPVLPFPIESTSLALTNIVELLSVIDVPSILLGGDRAVKFVSEGAKRLLELGASESLTSRLLEVKLGLPLPELKESFGTALNIGDEGYEFSQIPLTGGATGAVLLLKPQWPVAAAPMQASSPAPAPSAAQPDGDVDTALLSFVTETLLAPLQALRAALAATKTREPIVHEAIGTIDQVLSSLELSPHLDGVAAKRATPTRIADVLSSTAARYEKAAAAKAIRIQVDAPETNETFSDAENLSKVLGSLLENSLHYVPHGGQVVLGLRFLEHKGKPLIVFFVMDNGAVVPEEFREAIFSPGFVWDPTDSTRTGNHLPKARQFAAAHGGQVWVESKTGKACTFFIRVRPDHS